MVQLRETLNRGKFRFDLTALQWSRVYVFGLSFDLDRQET